MTNMAAGCSVALTTEIKMSTGAKYYRYQQGKSFRKVAATKVGTGRVMPETEAFTDSLAQYFLSID